MEQKRQIGKRGEELGAHYVKERGVNIIEKNYSCPFGEIDLIGIDRGTYVFFEVKYRRTKSFGGPEEAIDIRKQRKISKTADYYRMKHGLSERKGFRFDVLAITEEKITWHKNEFEYRR